MKITLFLTAALLASTPALAAPAAKFLDDAARGDTSEGTLGKVIASRGGSAAVRDYGTTLASDHLSARKDVDALAAKMHVRARHSMMPEAATEQRKLARLHGAAFDREVKRYMLDDHRKDISEFSSQAKGSEPLTARLAKDSLPMLRRHLAAAEAL